MANHGLGPMGNRYGWVRRGSETLGLCVTPVYEVLGVHGRCV